MTKLIKETATDIIIGKESLKRLYRQSLQQELFHISNFKKTGEGMTLRELNREIKKYEPKYRNTFMKFLNDCLR